MRKRNPERKAPSSRRRRAVVRHMTDEEESPFPDREIELGCPGDEEKPSTE